MTKDNFESALRSFCRMVPFQPFLIELVSGERMTVTHPKAVFLHNDLVVFTSPRKRYRLFDSSCVAELRDPEDKSGA